MPHRVETIDLKIEHGTDAIGESVDAIRDGLTVIRVRVVDRLYISHLWAECQKEHVRPTDSCWVFVRPRHCA